MDPRLLNKVLIRSKLPVKEFCKATRIYPTNGDEAVEVSSLTCCSVITEKGLSA